MASFQILTIDDRTYAKFRALVALEQGRPTINDVFLKLIDRYVEGGVEKIEKTA